MTKGLKLSLQFYGSGKEMAAMLSRLVDNGVKRLLVAPCTELPPELSALPGGEKLVVDLLAPDKAADMGRRLNRYDAVVLLEGEDLDLHSQLLHGCLDMKKGTVLAPITADYYKNRPLYMTTIPKSGTHLLIGLFDQLGIDRNTSSVPVPGMWSTINDYNYHAPCRDFFQNEWVNPLGTHPFFRSPALFMYRNPLDIVISEFRWYQRPNNSFNSYLSTLEDDDARLLAVINDRYVLGSIRERLVKFLGWLDLSNVIPVSYEELVGARGGGDDAIQRKVLWSLLLKLQIPGEPEKIGSTLYNEQSPTFSKGRAGGHRKLFKKAHYMAIEAMQQDFMEKSGYGKKGVQSVHCERFRKRRLKLARITEQEIWSQRLIKESYFGHNIVAANGQFAVISQALGSVDLSSLENRNRDGVRTGFATVAEAMNFILVENLSAKVEQALPAPVSDSNGNAASTGSLSQASPEPVPGLSPDQGNELPVLLEQGYCGFNLMSYNGVFYAVSQTVGDIDLSTADLTALLKNRLCFVVDGLHEIRERVVEAFAREMKNSDLPVIIEEGFNGFNIIAYRGTFFAVSQEAGSVDLSSIDLKLFAERTDCFTGKTLKAARRSVLSGLRKGLGHKG